MSNKEHLRAEAIEEVHQSIRRTSPYLERPLNKHLHQAWVFDLLQKVAKEREQFTVVDAGCGIGLLGAYLLNLTNITYIGVDRVEKFLEAGRELFRKLGHPSNFLCCNIYIDELPKADVFIFLGYEDEFTYYQRLYNICKKYNEIMISITGREMWEYTKSIRKNPPLNFISEKEFENIFSKDFLIREKKKIKRGRVLYWLQNSEIQEFENDIRF